MTFLSVSPSLDFIGVGADVDAGVDVGAGADVDAGVGAVGTGADAVVWCWFWHVRLIDYVKRITGKTSKTRNEGQEKGRKPKQKTRGDAEEPTETQRLSQHRVPRWKATLR